MKALSRSITFFVLLIPSISASAAPSQSVPATPDALATEARQIVQEYAGALQKTLKATIMTSGPASAIKTCNVHAPGISQQTAALTGWEVARTSKKLRNPAHQANSWENSVLSDFEKRASGGTPVEKLEHYEIREENGQQVFRYMKAIEVKNLCLNCHGPHVSGPVKTAVDDLYPTDQAVGYREGDLRGAFTLKKVLGSK